MSYPIKIKVRPQKTIRFPGICVNCAQPAAEMMPLRKRLGRVTRTINVPLCRDCHRELNRQSGDEERLGKIGRLAAGAVFVLGAALVLLLTPGEISLLLRLLVALALGSMLAQLALLLAQRAQVKAALPEKQAIRQSARVITFSWRATTFEFVNQTFVERFEAMNESLLMDA
ncbi:MAG: hypothetical protein H6667_05655 [Ardenticatenaceae bacterium]|nr:hypothetical protein [Ardenticatenaceae bacterium]MCB9444615.1 hypothetical protein [Ardenticatenaceae bacterium]